MKRARETQENDGSAASKRARIATIKRLPREILTHVLSFLDHGRDRLRVFLVCREWCAAANICFDPSARGNLAIRRACMLGRVETAKHLLADPRVDPSVRNNDAICWASLIGCKEIVGLLLAHPRVDPSDCGHGAKRSIPLRSCDDARGVIDGWCIAGVDIIRDWRIAGKNIHARNTALELALSRGHLGVVQMLLADSRVNCTGRCFF